MRRALILCCGFGAALALGLALWPVLRSPTDEPLRRVYDEAGIIPAGDIPRFEQYLQ